MKALITKNPVFKVVVAILFCGAIIVANFLVLYNISKTNLFMSRQSDVEQTAEEIDKYLLEYSDVIKLTAYNLSLMQEEARSASEMQEYVETETMVFMRAVNSAFTGLYALVDDNYVDGVGWVPDADYNAQERPWYIEAKEAGGNIALVTPYEDKQTGKIMMSVSKLMSDDKSVVAVDIGLDDIQRVVKNKGISSEWDRVMLIDDNGYVAASSDKSQIGKNYSEEEGTIGALILKELQKGQTGYFEIDYQGTDFMVFTSGIVDNWTVVATVREAKLLARINNLIILFVVSLLVIFGVTLTVAISMRKRQLMTSDFELRLKAMSGVYVAVLMIDLEENRIKDVLVQSDYVRSLMEGRREDAQTYLRVVMDIYTDERFKKGIYSFIQFSTLDERLKGNKSITREYISTEQGRCNARFAPVEWTKEGKLKSVMYMVERIQ